MLLAYNNRGFQGTQASVCGECPSNRAPALFYFRSPKENAKKPAPSYTIYLHAFHKQQMF